MTKKQLNTLQELMADETFKGKDQLSWLIWRNTAKPAFNVGDFVKVTVQGMRIYGFPVTNFNARVAGIRTWKIEKGFHYDLELTCIIDGKPEYKTTVYAPEGELKKGKTDINYLGVSKSKHAESITPTGTGI